MNQENALLSDCNLRGKPPLSVRCASDQVLAGQYFDQETGLHHNGFRPYDPEIGRYLQSDPMSILEHVQLWQWTSGSSQQVPLELNSYLYANANPLRYTDPTGEAIAIEGGVIIGGIVIAGACYASPGCRQAMQEIAQQIANAIQKMCEDDEDEDENCEALYQSILQTCAGLTGRKKFRCFEAARIARDQCYQERGR